MKPLSRLLAAQQRLAHVDDGPLLIWQSREEMLQRVRGDGTGLPDSVLALVFHEVRLLSGAPKRKNAPELG